MSNSKKYPCGYCGALFPQTARSIDDLVGWLEVHSPSWAPAHRKCTDACESDASLYLRGRAFEIVENLTNRWQAQRLSDNVPDIRAQRGD